jgi:hypothetical protein
VVPTVFQSSVLEEGPASTTLEDTLVTGSKKKSQANLKKQPTYFTHILVRTECMFLKLALAFELYSNTEMCCQTFSTTIKSMETV